jgi:hypothetical protein
MKTLLKFVFCAFTGMLAGSFSVLSVWAAQPQQTGDYEGDLQMTLSKVLQNDPQVRFIQGDRAQIMGAIKVYVDLLNAHQLKLKNVVHRSDTGLLRLTWSSFDDRYVVKVAYKTNSDRLLTHSNFADRDQVVDIKFVYYQGDELRYFRIESPRDAQGHFIEPRALVVQDTNSPELCGFCHELAKTDGSPSGLFFPRYQSKHKSQIPSSTIFDLSEFKAMSKGEMKSLGLPEIEDVLVKKVPLSNLNSSYARIVFEMPELVEIFARDNQKSVCLAVEFAADSPFDKVGWVCSDVKEQTTHVRFTNPMLTSFKGRALVSYSKPFYDVMQTHTGAHK